MIISLTTIPSRLPHIGPCIESLEQQGFPVYVWIPETARQTGDKFDGDIPSFLDDCEAEVVKGRGPITKLLPALEISDLIVTADDDALYGDGWAEGLLKWHEKLPGVALYYRGRNLTDRHYNHAVCAYDVSIPMQIDLGTGVWGALYSRSFFGEEIFEDWKRWPANDDLVINTHLRERGVKRAVVPRLPGCEIRPYGVHEIDSLWRENRQKNDRGLEVLGWWDDSD